MGSSQPKRPRLRGHGPPAGTATNSKCSETSMGSICLDTKRAVRPPAGWEDKAEGSHTLPRSLAWSPCILAGQLGRKAPGWGPRSKTTAGTDPLPDNRDSTPLGQPHWPQLRSSGHCWGLDAHLRRQPLQSSGGTAGKGGEDRPWCLAPTRMRPQGPPVCPEGPSSSPGLA